MRKRYLALPALILGFFLMGNIQTAQATVQTVSEDLVVSSYVSQLQTFEAKEYPTYVVTPALRDTYAVTVVSVVQYPTVQGAGSTWSDGFGARDSPCSGCSSMHMGVDFTPGGGTTVLSVADAVVIATPVDGGGLGYSVTLQSTINGVVTVTKYGHMQAGSVQVSVGQVIPRGTVLGLVGSTGASTGNHLHFQVEVGGTPIDPVAWLQTNANDWMWPGLQ